MQEEQITKYILKWLLDNRWEIICFDFPQSGTGRFLHPNNSAEKNKKSINPDIVAYKNNICLFFENKSKYFYKDYIKQHQMIVSNDYSDAINELLCKYSVLNYYYGIGMPLSDYNGPAVKNKEMVDFIVGVGDQGEVCFVSNPKSIAL